MPLNEQISVHMRCGAPAILPEKALYLVKRFFFIFLCVSIAGGSSFAEERGFQGDLQLFYQLLKEYSQYNEFSSKLSPDERKKYDEITLRHLKGLDAKSLQARFEKYNVDYSIYRKLLLKAERELQKISKRLDQIPITNKNRRREEYALAAQQNRVGRIQRYLFYSSVNANNSILESLDTFNVADKVKAEKRVEAEIAAVPDLPGVEGPSRQERLRKKEGERINLMPVDDDFYQTELGKKLNGDLGGRADFWSYDFERDELYVQVGDKVGKLLVREDGPGVRFVQTKVGEGFNEPVGSAMKVDLFQSKGRFLTGDRNEETLFGPYPDKKEKLLEENKPQPASDHP